MAEPRNGWAESAKYVNEKIREFGDCYTALLDKYLELKIEVEVIKVENRTKNGLWGAIGGLIPAVGVLIYLIIKNTK